MKGGCGPGTGWADVAATAADGRKWRSRQILERGQRFAAGWVGSCDAGRAAGSGCGFGGDGVAAAADVAAVDGAAASAGAAAGVGAGS